MRPPRPAQRFGASLAALLALADAGCAPPASGLGEPLRIREGAFRVGPLPGAGAPSPSDAAAPPGGPQITAYENANAVVRWFQAGKGITGRTSPDAYAVAVRLADVGTGYWVVPAGAVDPTANSERVFGLTADFGGDIPPGRRALQLVAVDGDGVAGPRTDIDLCLVGEVPDNLNACDATLAPPAAVVALTWDREVDLDLVVVSPEGKRIDWRHPTTATPDGGRITDNDLAAADLGALDRNSNASCVIDGARREQLVWQAPPRAGRWTIYGNLFHACGQPDVSLRATVLRRQGGPDSGQPYELVETERADGHLDQLAANGGTALGLRLLEVTLP